MLCQQSACLKCKLPNVKLAPNPSQKSLSCPEPSEFPFGCLLQLIEAKSSEIGNKGSGDSLLKCTLLHTTPIVQQSHISFGEIQQ